MDNLKYSDCAIKFFCSNGKFKYCGHRSVLSGYKYFDKLFSYEPPKIKILDHPLKHAIHVYKINIPVTAKSLIKSLNLIYADFKYYNIKKFNISILDCLSFLIPPDYVIEKYLRTLSFLIYSEKNNKYELLKKILENINIHQTIKKNILTRFLNELSDTEKTHILNQYPNSIPTYLWNNKSYADDHKIIISSNDRYFEYNQIRFYIDQHEGDCSTIFRISAQYIGEQIFSSYERNLLKNYPNHTGIKDGSKIILLPQNDNKYVKILATGILKVFPCLNEPIIIPFVSKSSDVLEFPPKVNDIFNQRTKYTKFLNIDYVNYMGYEFELCIQSQELIYL